MREHVTTNEKTSATIYIVEDHDIVRNLLVQLVERTPGVSLVGVAASAEEALEHIPARRPRLVLVDVSLPGMDGIDLIRLLHDRWPDIRTLAISGHDEALYAAATLNAGAHGYVMKGNVIQITEAIQRILEGEIYLSPQLRDLLNPDDID